MEDTHKTREELIGELLSLRERVAKMEALEAERKQVEQRMIHLERMRALGEMGQGIAHNFNNLLVGVLGYAQVIQLIASDPEITDPADRIVASALRAKDLVSRLNRSLRGEGAEVGPLKVNRVVQEAAEAARPRWKDGPEASGVSIELLTDLETVPSAGGTEGGLHEVVIDLLFNAVDALPEGGTIEVATKAVGEEVWLEVRDTGVGMDEDTKKQMFDPFFTSKADVGSGLGLSAVHGIVTRWGGSIDVETAPGKGSTFTVRLPVWTGPKAVEEKVVPKAPRKRGRKVLTVDDELEVRYLVRTLLSEDHTVEEASDGKEALERFRPGQYDVVLIDLGMPGMPGDELAREIREVDPKVATVLVTGWELEKGDERAEALDFQLRKPFHPLQSVADMVDWAGALYDARAGGEA